MNCGLTDKALRLGVVGVKTDAKPGQTKEKVRDLAIANVGRAQIFRIDLQGEKEEFEGPPSNEKVVPVAGFGPLGL